MQRGTKNIIDTLTGIPPRQRELYRSKFVYILNNILFPLKMLVPQPIIRRLPLLTTNLDIRTGIILTAVQGRLLDIGCGENCLVRAWRAKGGDGVGVDVYPWPGLDLVVEDSAHLPFDTASFDTVTLVACLNHIPERKAVLAEVRRLLPPGGRLIITALTPMVSRIWHMWAFWDADQHERGMKEGEVWGFAPGEVAALATEAGFRLDEETGFSWNLNRMFVFVAEPVL
jgi:SAM-dependent methyltransferase